MIGIKVDAPKDQLEQPVIIQLLEYLVLHIGKKIQIIFVLGYKSNKVKNKNKSLDYHIIIGFILILFNFSFAYSQSLFEKTYQINDGGLMGGWGLVTDDYLIWSGSSLPDEDGITASPNSVWYGALIVTNGSGDTLWTKVNFDSVYKTTYGPVVDNLDGTFWVVGDKVDQSNHFYEYFVEQYNYTNSQPINSFEFQDSIPFTCQKLKKLSSGELILGGFYDDSLGIAKAYLLEINTNGNINWRLELPAFSTSVNQVIQIEETNNSLLVAELYLDIAYYTQIANFSVNLSGQILATDSFPSLPVPGFGISGLYFINSGSKMIIGGQFANTSFFDVGILKADINSLVINPTDTIGGSYTEYLNGATKIDSFKGFFSGQMYSNFNGMQYDAYSILVDSGGKVVNDYSFGDQNFEDKFYMTDELNNTYISFGNSIRNTPNGLRNLAYIVRYDSLGNISTGRSELLQEQVVQVFPNPAKEELYIKLNGYSQKGETDSEYTLFDAKGNSVLCGLLPINATTSLNVSNMVSGIYCLVVKNGNAIISRKVIID